jgi:hypothetical protein
MVNSLIAIMQMITPGLPLTLASGIGTAERNSSRASRRQADPAGTGNSKPGQLQKVIVAVTGRPANHTAH